MTDADTNALGQPVGMPVPGWTARPWPPTDVMDGRLCRVEPLAIGHASALYEANATDTDGRMWTYLSYGPFTTLGDYERWLGGMVGRDDPQFHAIVDLRTGRPVGVASLLRTDTAAGSTEVGHIAYSPLLQRRPAATEAMFLLMRRVFELGYRRYEWKCNALNGGSRAAALRLGFSFEGVFRQALVTKGRNRDTAWYAAIDAEWPALRAAYERWLDPANFDTEGRQRVSLSSLTAPLLARRG